MNPPPMEKECALIDDCVRGVESREADAIGMLRLRAGRKHDVAMEEQVAVFVEFNWLRSREVDTFFASANGGDCGINRRRVDRRRLIARETEQDGAIRGVADAGEGQRAVEVCLHASNAIDAGRDPTSSRAKAARGAHGAHGVRTGWADADFVEVEEAGGHG